jgi:NADH-quinone oxidoreductase subunit F
MAEIHPWPDELWAGKSAVLVGAASCGQQAGAQQVARGAEAYLRDEGIAGEMVRVGCLGACFAEPVVTLLQPGLPGVCYGKVSPSLLPRLLDAYFLGKSPLREQALGTTGESQLAGLPALGQTPFFSKQRRWVLRKCGFIDPLNLDHALSTGGYSGLKQALQMRPEEVIAAVKQAGLRGRGGAGFPTGRKWELARAAAGDEKYIVCNAAEGDIGAFMDRMLLESDPQTVLEGMAIAGYACGASKGYVYIRSEYESLPTLMEKAISQATGQGYLGRDVLGTGFSFEVEVFAAAGRYVCGEETALINSMEGKRGVPRLRPPFPIQAGLWDRPTVINNVKTLANVPLIFDLGTDLLGAVGTEKSKGTAILSLGGSVVRSGVVEVPMGMPLGEVIHQIGGGVAGGKKLKAVQTGGPLGGVIPESLIGVAVDFDAMKAVGSPLGSGGMIVMDEDACMVEAARGFVEFALEECCGHCVLCRLGTVQMHEIIRDIGAGRGKLSDLDLLSSLGEAMVVGSFCAFGQGAPGIVLSALKHFRGEFEDHILHHRCATGACFREGVAAGEAAPE